MDIKTILTAGVTAALVVVVGIFALVPKPTQLPTDNHPVGSITSSLFNTNYFGVGGLVEYKQRMALNTATTTPCAIQSPPATSTLGTTYLIIQTATTTATQWTPATSTTAFATTTGIVPVISLGSGAQGTMTAATSTGTLNGPNIMPPNSWVVWGVAGINRPVDTTLLTGYCQATFTVVSG